MTKIEQVIEFVKNEKIVRPRDLQKQGLPAGYLYELASRGVIERISRGLYQWPGAELSQHQALAEACKLSPKATVTLLSALTFHNVTSQNPFEVWLAIDHKGWRPRINYPPVRYITMSGPSLVEGIERHTIDGVGVNIFCLEKTIADCFKFRNKVGLDVALEALREGWKQQKFTINSLMKYAGICKVKRVMLPYVESLVP